MTESEFLAMSPRERDAAVAVARGQDITPTDHQWGESSYGDAYPYCEIRHCSRCHETDYVCGCQDPPDKECVPYFPIYTTNICAAWGLVEEMRDSDEFNDELHGIHWCSASEAAFMISTAYLKARGAIVG